MAAGAGVEEEEEEAEAPLDTSLLLESPWVTADDPRVR